MTQTATKETVFTYRNPDGSIAYKYVRYDEPGKPKRFVARRPDGKGGYITGLGDTTHVLYRLPELLESPISTIVYIPEGEKCVDILAQLGLVATTNDNGTGSWRDEYSQYLKSRHVVILPDNDEAGRKHAHKVATSLTGIAATIKIVELPGLREKEDVFDFLTTGGEIDFTTEAVLEAMISICNNTKYYDPAARRDQQNGHHKETPLQGTEEEYSIPPLPENVKANEEGAELASPTLDALIAYFERWATRSYKGYHEAVAVWVLATIAARRIVLKWRGGFWTNFYIMLVSVSGRHAKTEAASYGTKVIQDCELGFLLAPEETTPQQLLSRMSGKKTPRNYACMDDKEKEKLCHKLAFSAQKGWQYDEFGDFLQEVITSRGYSNLFYRLLKQMYDNKPELTYDTATRGEENIKLPSLNIIGTTAPESLTGIAKKDSKVWTDGAFARIAFIVPPADSLELKSAPMGDAIVPGSIIAALTAWHDRLGVPTCKIIDLEEQEELMEEAHGKDDKRKKKNFNGEPYKIEREDLPQNDIYWNDSIHQAHQTYYQTLVEMGKNYNLDARLNSNYIRLPDMALKIAMLLASLENNGHMNMRHWARGQQITERWRANLHELLTQLTSNRISTRNYGDMEDQIIDVLTKLEPEKKVDTRFISRQTRPLRQLGSIEVRKICDELAGVKVIEKEGVGKNALYGVKSGKETTN